MVDFNAEATVSASAIDILRILILQRRNDVIFENEGYSPSHQNNQNNQKVGLHSLTHSEQVKTTGNTGYTGESASTGRFRKLPDLVHHKCAVCDLSPCQYEDERGRPVCELCAQERTGGMNKNGR